MGEKKELRAQNERLLALLDRSEEHHGDLEEEVAEYEEIVRKLKDENARLRNTTVIQPSRAVEASESYILGLKDAVGAIERIISEEEKVG